MAACAILYVPSLFWTLGLDQNIFAEIGSLLLKGKKLYVDAWDVKPPNVFYIYALFEWIFGPHEIAVRLSDYVFAIFACGAIFIVTDRQSSLLAWREKEWIAPLASILFILTLLSLGLADTAQTESYSLVFIIAASLFAAPGEKGNDSVRLLASGVAIGIATFFKTSNAIFLFAIIAEVLIYRRINKQRTILYCIAGFFVWCIFQLAVLAMTGSLAEYLRIASSVLLHHTSEVSNLRIVDLPRALWTYLDVWTLFSAIALAVSIVQRDRQFLRAAISPLLLLAAGIGAVLIQRKGWGYHYVIVLPGLAWLSAISGIYLYRMVLARFRTIAYVLVGIVLVATLFATPSAWRRIRYIFDAEKSITNHAAYLASLGSMHSLYYPPATDSLAKYLEQHTQPQETVFIFGDEPGAYWRADRMSATRYVYTLLFTSGVISNSDVRAMQDSLARKKPEHIVVERFDTTVFRGKSETSESLEDTDRLFQPLHALLKTSYTAVDTVSENFILFDRINIPNR